ncbi:MAG: 50S ribosomal protein L29 [Ignisphaera sp.]|nr:50S ribosomal protein L29 [Ignisphaera sp.]MCX8168487.1 50S ribosomal protein L29 [Ignisphaera sp.]
MSDRPLSADEIRSMNYNDRLHLLRELRLELIRLRTQAQSGTLTNTSRIKMLRKNIARILTVINEERIKK